VTVYKTLKRLLESGYVKQKMGNRGSSDTEVTCYNITASGKEYLNENLKQELGTYTQDYFRFDLSIGLASYIDIDEKIQLIEQRMIQLRQRLKELRRQIKNYKGGTAFGGWIVLDHQINHLKSEISWMKRLITLFNEQGKG
jgi:DNA-binding PadR family transcriptional regulator